MLLWGIDNVVVVFLSSLVFVAKSLSLLWELMVFCVVCCFAAVS